MITPVHMRLSRAWGFRLQAASRAINGLPAVILDDLRRLDAHIELAAREAEIMRRDFEMLQARLDAAMAGDAG